VLLARRKSIQKFGNRPRLIPPRLVAGHELKVHGKIIREGRRLGEDKDEDFGRKPAKMSPRSGVDLYACGPSKERDWVGLQAD
jgi:hypothetical protein